MRREDHGVKVLVSWITGILFREATGVDSGAGGDEDAGNKDKFGDGARGQGSREWAGEGPGPGRPVDEAARMGGLAPMTYTLVSPAALEKAIDRMAEELGVSRGALLEALTPVVIGWAIARISEDLGVTPREARTRIARAIDRTA